MKEEHFSLEKPDGTVYNLRFKHNLPKIEGMSIEDAIYNWAPRTNEYTVASLAEYIASKDPDSKIIEIPTE